MGGGVGATDACETGLGGCETAASKEHASELYRNSRPKVSKSLFWVPFKGGTPQSKILHLIRRTVSCPVQNIIIILIIYIVPYVVVKFSVVSMA